jgi:tetratricopeptide (TPR) repeat protein
MMRKKTFVITLFLIAGTTAAFAQSENCNINSSVSHEAVRAGNYKDAYLPWKEVLKECPLLRFYTFADGFRILKALLDEDIKANGNKKTSAEYKKYFNELMEVHDTRMKYIPEFQQKMRGVLSVETALGNKAIDYLAYAPDADIHLAYKWLNESVNGAKAEAAPSAFQLYVELSLQIFKGNESHKEQFIQDYLNASQYVDDALVTEEKEVVRNTLQTIKDNLVAFFINSGVADCESLEAIYTPKVEENKTDLTYLKKVIDIMKMMRCTDQEAYFNASLYSYRIEPTAGAAAGCAYMYFKKGDINAAVKFFDEAIELEQEESKKAEWAYAVAVVLSTDKRLSQSRAYALKAININPNYGAPYILIANLYAGSPNWNDETILNKCTYFLILDKLQKAKSVDPSVTEDVNKLIGIYSKYTPASNDLFMVGYKLGDKIVIGGWIGEATTIR